MEANIEETLTFYRLPLSHHKHMKSTNMLERQNEEIKRRTRVVRTRTRDTTDALEMETHGTEHPSALWSVIGGFPPNQ